MSGPWRGVSFPLAPLGHVGEIQLGKMLQPATSSEFDRETPYLRAGSLATLDTPGELPTMFASHRDRELFGVEVGDLIVAEGGDCGQASFVPSVPAGTIIQNSLHRIRCDNDDLRYVRYCLSAIYSSNWLDVLCNKSTFGHLTSEKLAALRIPHPTFDEQQAIADYLDRETARIDALIVAKERSIHLSAERRQAVRDASFGAAPGFRLKHLLAAPMAYGVLVPEFVEPGTGVPMIRTYNLTERGTVDHQDIAEIPSKLSNEYRRTELHDGDVILSVVGSMGRAARVGPREAGSNLNRPLARFRPLPEFGQGLLWHWTQTTQFMDAALLATGRGTAQPTLNLGDLANFRVGLPDEEERWPELLAELDSECDTLYRLEDVARTQVRLLGERRQALIAAAVTGQIEVPVAA